MPPPTTQQRGIIAEFLKVTGTTDSKVAQRFLKNSAYKLEDAVGAFFDSSIPSGSSHTSREQALKNQFASLQTSEDGQDTVGVDGTMKYFTALGVDLEDASMFVPLEVVQAEGIGEMRQENFVRGWKATSVAPNLAAQRNHIRNVVSSLSQIDTFRKIYRYAFVAVKDPTQRAITVEEAIVYWDILFKAPGRPWIGKANKTNFLALWTKFLREKWTKSVNKDMWNQILEFANKSMEDEELSFWSEDASWPGVIDDFVVWYRERQAKADDDMDVDA